MRAAPLGVRQAGDPTADMRAFCPRGPSAVNPKSASGWSPDDDHGAGGLTGRTSGGMPRGLTISGGERRQPGPADLVSGSLSVGFGFLQGEGAASRMMSG